MFFGFDIFGHSKLKRKTPPWGQAVSFLTLQTRQTYCPWWVAQIILPGKPWQTNRYRNLKAKTSWNPFIQKGPKTALAPK